MDTKYGAARLMNGGKSLKNQMKFTGLIHCVHQSLNIGGSLEHSIVGGSLKMQFDIKKIAPFTQVQVEIDGELHTIGLLTPDEAKEFALKLISAAYDVLND